MNGERPEHMAKFSHFSVDIEVGRVGFMEAEVSHRVGERVKVLRVLTGVWGQRYLSVEAKMRCLRELSYQLFHMAAAHGL